MSPCDSVPDFGVRGSDSGFNLSLAVPNPEHRTPIPGLDPLIDGAPARLSVASVLSPATKSVGREHAGFGRLVGTLVHRLLQRLGIDVRDAHAVREVALRLIRAEELDHPDNALHIAEAAVDAYQSACARDDMRALYQSGRALHEVPFTMSLNGRIVRGTIDCLVESAPGVFTVLEFKTGRERPEDEQQVQMYVQALRHVFPEAAIDARVVYTGVRSAPTV